MLVSKRIKPKFNAIIEDLSKRGKEYINFQGLTWPKLHVGAARKDKNVSLGH